MRIALHVLNSLSKIYIRTDNNPTETESLLSSLSLFLLIL